MSIFKSAEAQSTMEAWYDRFLEDLDHPYELVDVDTSFGPNRVVICGPADGPPLVLTHGALAGAPHALGQMKPLLDHCRVYAVDVIGQSVRAPQVRPDIKGTAYGEWLVEVLDGLGLERFALMGVSWGGFVALNAARVCPERIEALVLLNPAALVRGPILAPLLRITLPMMANQAFPSDERKRKAFAGLMTSYDEKWTNFLDDAMRSVVMDFRAPPIVRSEELAAFDAPVLVFGGDDDIMFPGRRLVERSRSLFRNLRDAVLFDGCKHVPPTTPEFVEGWTSRVREFLDDASEARAAG